MIKDAIITLICILVFTTVGYNFGVQFGGVSIIKVEDNRLDCALIDEAIRKKRIIIKKSEEKHL